MAKANPDENINDQYNGSTQKNKNKKAVIGLTLTFIAIAGMIFFWWLLWGRFVVSTQDAYVHGNQVTLTPQIPGIVTQVNVNDTELVNQGQVLIELDKTDRTITFEMAKSHLADTIRNVTTMFENVYALAAQFEMKQAALFSAEVDYLDRKNIVSEGAVSDEDFIHAESTYYAAKASVDFVKFQLMQAISKVQNTKISNHPLVEKAKQDVRQAWVNLQRCTLKAPATGIIAQRNVQVGESVAPSSPLLAIVPLDQIWVNANFKENDLESIRIGQPVTLTADMYGHSVQYAGEVIGIGSGTGAVFSALPPQNATGNWIKIVQRIPVRIAVNMEQVRRFPLFLGLSMKVDVDIRDRQGRRLPVKTSVRPLYVTDVFNDQTLGVDQLVDDIVNQNLTFDMSISHEVLSLVGR